MSARFQDSLTSPKIEGFEWQEPEDEGDIQMFRNILEEGCHILQIHPAENRLDEPEYFFSIGFYINLVHPEVLVAGLSSAVAGNMINDIFHYVEDGNTLQDGEFFRYEIGERVVRFALRTVPNERYWDYLGYANWFYRSLLFNVHPLMEHKYPVLQLVWPDANGNYPWDDDCDPKVREFQTLIDLEEEG